MKHYEELSCSSIFQRSCDPVILKYTLFNHDLLLDIK